MSFEEAVLTAIEKRLEYLSKDLAMKLADKVRSDIDRIVANEVAAICLSIGRSARFDFSGEKLTIEVQFKGKE